MQHTNNSNICPNEDAEEEEKEEFYEDLIKLVKEHKKSRDKLIIMGDWNGKVGSKREPSIICPYGIGERNNNGERLLDLCQQLKLTVMNTWFEQKEHTAYTWTSPDKTTSNQIDYILVSERYKNSVKNAKARPSADCGSDHIPVVMTPKVYLEKD